MEISAFLLPHLMRMAFILKKKKVKLPDINIGKRTAHFPSFNAIIFVKL